MGAEAHPQRPLGGVFLGFVSANHVPYDGTTQRTVATANSAPLLDRAVVAHAHVSAHVQDGIDGLLEADGTVDAGRAVDWPSADGSAVRQGR